MQAMSGLDRARKFQSALRQAREQALSLGHFAILDVGSAKMSCLVVRFEGMARADADGGVGALAGQPRIRVIGGDITRSRGVRFGEIVDVREAERAIRTVVQGAQKRAETRVNHVFACMSGGAPRSDWLDASVELESQVVTESEIGRVLERCEPPELGEDRHVQHAQPVNFAVDNRSGLTDPREQLGQVLSADLHMLTVDTAAIANLATCIRRCDLEPAGLTLSAYMSGLATLVEDERELGAACIDLGAGTTSLTIFCRKHMILAETIRAGGESVTRDIQLGLDVPRSVAERVKTLHGGLRATGRDDAEQVDLGGEGEGADRDWDRRWISRTELIGIIRPRIEEILDEARARLLDAGFADLPSQQIVLTGGGSQMPGLDALAAQLLGQQVRLGRPMRIAGQAQAFTGPESAAAVGLGLHSAQPQDEWWDFELPQPGLGGRALNQTISWLKRNW